MSVIQITIRSSANGVKVKDLITKHFQKLNHIYKKMDTVKIVVEDVKNRNGQGTLFKVNLGVHVPGKKIISQKQNSNVYIAIRDVFLATDKLLKKHLKRKMLYDNKIYLCSRLNNIKSCDLATA